MSQQHPPEDPTGSTHHAPFGSVAGLCAAGATCFALCIAFLGVWGFQGSGPWRPRHLLVVAPLVVACFSFGLTPYMATRSVEHPEPAARRCYGLGVLLLVVAVIAAVAITYLTPEEI